MTVKWCSGKSINWATIPKYFGFFSLDECCSQYTVNVFYKDQPLCKMPSLWYKPLHSIHNYFIYICILFTVI